MPASCAGMEVEMLRALCDAVIHRVLVVSLLLLPLLGCDNSVQKYKTAAGLRGQIEAALRQMETGRLVPGLDHRHVTVEPDSEVDGFAVKITDMKLGDPKVGFQSFSEMTFSLAQADATHFVADHFRLTPVPVGKGPEEASQTLVELLQRAASTLHDTDD
ncbi:MAG TPA: hypothetical protein VHA35_14260 [Dongiaceae bacterium]|nr:hypothetical protein [Dongiaceae bacterium]